MELNRIARHEASRLPPSQRVFGRSADCPARLSRELRKTESCSTSRLGLSSGEAGNRADCLPQPNDEPRSITSRKASRPKRRIIPGVPFQSAELSAPQPFPCAMIQRGFFKSKFSPRAPMTSFFLLLRSLNRYKCNAEEHERKKTISEY